MNCFCVLCSWFGNLTGVQIGLCLVYFVLFNDRQISVCLHSSCLIVYVTRSENNHKNNEIIMHSILLSEKMWNNSAKTIGYLIELARFGRYVTVDAWLRFCLPSKSIEFRFTCHYVRWNQVADLVVGNFGIVLSASSCRRWKMCSKNCAKFPWLLRRRQ